MQQRQVRKARRPGAYTSMTVAVLAIGFGLVASLPATAQDAPQDPAQDAAQDAAQDDVQGEERLPGSDPFYERFKLRVGGFAAGSSTSIRFDGADVGTTIDFEDDLGLDERDFLPSFDASYRFNRKSRIEASYFSLSRDGTRELSGTIEFGDTEFTVGTDVTTEFSTNIWRLSYAFSFVNNPRAEFGFLAGLHLIDVGTSLISVGGTTLRQKEGDVTAPLPVFGLHGGYAFAPNISLAGRGQLFKISIDRYSGTLIDLFAALQYDFSPHVGVAAGYQFYHADLDIEGEILQDFVGTVEFEYQGPTLSAVVRF